MEPAFVLGDFVSSDPLYSIYQRKDGRTNFFYEYEDYFQYLKYLMAIWERLREDYRNYGIHNKYSDKLIESQGKHSEEDVKKWQKYGRAGLLLQLDSECFITFARILMDKVAKVVECFVELPKGADVGDTFPKHKQFFTKPENFSYNPAYSKLLKNEITWYDQNLSPSRNKMIVHGRVFGSGIFVSPKKGVWPMKIKGVFEISSENVEKLLSLKQKYATKYPELQYVGDNSWKILQYLKENDIKLDEDDRKSFVRIVQEAGGTMDAVGIAKNLKGFLEVVAKIFGSKPEIDG